MGQIYTTFSGAPLASLSHALPVKREILTNREFYLGIACLRQKHRNSPRELDAYLRALMDLATAHRDRGHLTSGTFIGLLQQAFHAPARAFSDAWHDTPVGQKSTDPYTLWEQTIVEQIADLREMRKTASTSSTWVNTAIPDYLECAAAGTFGGWELGDETSIREIDWHTARRFLIAGQTRE
jgi:hypothetical protein